jgi:uncharacterized repeat protein (TIGR01451 family)
LTGGTRNGDDATRAGGPRRWGRAALAILGCGAALAAATLVGASGGATAKAPQADLSVTVSNIANPVFVGGALGYVIEVGNAGPDPARGVVVSDRYPAGARFRSLAKNRGSCRVRRHVHRVVCRLATLESGAGVTSAPFRIGVHLRAPKRPRTVSSTASVRSNVHDPNHGNNRSTATTSVIRRPARHHTLTVATLGHGFGHVTGPGIDCPDGCSARYPTGTTVVLHTPHGAHTRFAGWGGDCSDRGLCSLTMDADRSVSATFKFKAPDTRITRANVKPHKHRATFSFEAKGKAHSFECKVTRVGHHKRFKECSSPKRYVGLKRGEYTFKARAKGPGGTDPKAAHRTFRIKRLR